MGNCSCCGGDISTIFKSQSETRFYLFDWDDNVVHMPTHVWMEDSSGTPVPLTTAEYARRRGEPGLRPQRSDFEYAFREFRDGPGMGDFEGDLNRAMAGPDSSWKAPSFDKFREAVIAARPFAIITARGHSEKTLRGAVARFIDKILTPKEQLQMATAIRKRARFARCDKNLSDKEMVEQYLKSCHFVGVSHPDYKNSSGAANPEEGKKHAIREFVRQIIEEEPKNDTTNFVFGMSDDDGKNVSAIEALFKDELSPKYPCAKFVTFDTGSGRTRRLKSHHVF